MSIPLQALIVEDSEDDAFLLVAELERGGYKPMFVRVDTEIEMIEALDRQSWDIIFSDYSMPAFRATDALQLIQSFGLDVPFIIISGAIGEAEAVALMKAGANDYLIKGKLGRLIPVIERELREADSRLAKRQAEISLRQAYEDLDVLVQERTDQLAKVSQQNQLILDAVAEGILGLDASGEIAFINPAAAKMTGYSAEELIGRTLQDKLYRISPDDPTTPILATFTEERFQQTDGIFNRKDGSFFAVEYSSTLIRENEAVVGAVVTFRDITERQAIEHIKDEFISAVSHELRTPLSSIRGSLTLLATQQLGELNEKGRQVLKIAINNSDRLVRLLNDILDLERLGSGKIQMVKQACDVNDLMQQSVECVQEIAATSDIEISVSPPAASCLVWADSDRIVQVLTNLLSNAIKFSPPHATVYLTSQIEGDLLKFEVKDNGRGIPTSKLDVIFGRFQQVDASDSRQKGGTGLGLAICHDLVQQHDGKIWAESSLGVGSSFYFTLPRFNQSLGNTGKNV